MPKGLVESLAEASILAVYRACHDELSYIALQEGILAGVLLKEEYSSEDANKLTDISKEMEATIDMLGKAGITAAGTSDAAKEGWNSIVDALKSELSTVNPAEVINLMNDPDPKALQKKAAELTQVLQKVLGEIAAIVETIESFQKNFSNIDVPEGVDPEKTMTLLQLSNASSGKGEEEPEPTEPKTESYALADHFLFEEPKPGEETEEQPEQEGDPAQKQPEVETKTGWFPDAEKLKKAIETAYKEPNWFKQKWAAGTKAAEKAVAAEEGGGGFMDKAIGFIKGLFGGGAETKIVSGELLGSAILNTPYETFKTLDLSGLKGDLADTTTGTADNTTQALETAVENPDDPGGQPEGDEPPPATEEESIESQKAAEEAAKAAALAAAKENDPPGVAVGKAIEGWRDALPDSTQKWIQAAGRYDDLKGGVEAVFADQAKTMSGAVETAIAGWHEKNADAITKSKRFSKKSQAALQKMIPDMVASIMQKKHESTGRFTYGTVQRAVYRYCDNYYFNSGMLIESNRWGKLAGLGEDR